MKSCGEMTERRDSIEELNRLKGIIDRLRSPGGCPWDREQTPATLKPFLLEEAHEVAEAIDSGDSEELAEELGDLLMNIFLQARIAEEEHRFTLSDVARGISEKLIRRHPHVFGDVEAADSDAVRKNWEEIKRGEKNDAALESALRRLPASLPALEQAQRLGEMAAAVGFDWPDASGPLEKMEEEFEELRDALECNRPDQIMAEIGDLLFATASLCRQLGVDSERSLKLALARFRERFHHLEKELANQSGSPSLAELERAWQEAKRALGEKGTSS